MLFEPSWVSFIEKQPDSSAPCWLARTNPDWEGNYKVQYWSEDWQQIVLAYLDRIIADGFDGVYLDIIDAFEYWSDRNNGEGYYISEREAAGRMINFVKRLAYHARFIRGKTDFLDKATADGYLPYAARTDRELDEINSFPGQP